MKVWLVSDYEILWKSKNEFFVKIIFIFAWYGKIGMTNGNKPNVETLRSLLYVQIRDINVEASLLAILRIYLKVIVAIHHGLFKYFMNGMP